MTTFDLGQTKHRPIEYWASFGIFALTLVLGVLVAWRADHRPRTDDAEIFANLIGMAPQVEGPIVELKVRDNQSVKKGDLLFIIDPRPYQYALEKAESAQAALEGGIGDEQRRIAAQVSGVSVAKAGIQSAEADVHHRAAAVDQARATCPMPSRASPGSRRSGHTPATTSIVWSHSWRRSSLQQTRWIVPARRRQRKRRRSNRPSRNCLLPTPN
jgi:multidrug efflux pump subunit AcrA (membrane-fusion protein)